MEALTEDEKMELQVIKQVFIDEAPEEDWQSQVDPQKLVAYREEIRKWSARELMKFCKEHYAWDGDPSYTQALIDVIGEVSD